MDIQPIMDFWYNFDLLFNTDFGQVPQDILYTYHNVFQLVPDWLVDCSKSNIQNYPSNFIDGIKNSNEMIDSIKLLCKYQIQEFNKLLNLDNGKELLEKAFEGFGQGILFDDLIDKNTNQPR